MKAIHCKKKKNFQRLIVWAGSQLQWLMKAMVIDAMVDDTMVDTMVDAMIDALVDGMVDNAMVAALVEEHAPSVKNVSTRKCYPYRVA